MRRGRPRESGGLGLGTTVNYAKPCNVPFPRTPTHRDEKVQGWLSMNGVFSYGIKLLLDGMLRELPGARHIKLGNLGLKIFQRNIKKGENKMTCFNWQGWMGQLKAKKKQTKAIS